MHRLSFAALLSVCTILLIVTFTTPTSTYGASSNSADAWIQPFNTLLRRIGSLPFEEKSSLEALELIREYRASSYNNATDWSHRIAKLYITKWENRAFPDAIDQLKSHPSFLPEASGYDLTEYDDDSEEGEGRKRPMLFRPNLIHILAARGFDRAMREVVSYFPPASVPELFESTCRLSAALDLEDVHPVHLLALYSDDIAQTPTRTQVNDPELENGNIGIAYLFKKNGVNLTITPSSNADMNALLFAGERGHYNLFVYLLNKTIPKKFFTQDFKARYPYEHEAEREFLHYRQEILLKHERDLAAGEEEMNEEEWKGYLKWYDEARRPKYKEQMEVEVFWSFLYRTLSVSVMSGRVNVVRHLLSNPDYRLREEINTRSHEGKGDCLLHGAITQGHIEMAQLLLEHGADPKLKSYDKLSLIQLAQKYQKFDMASWLEKYMRSIKPPPKSARDPAVKRAEEEEARARKEEEEQTKKLSEESKAHDEL